MSHVVIVGLGNIGSHLAPLVARLPGVSAMTLVDPDRYEVSNLGGQHAYTPDVGKSKAQAQARRLRQIDRDLSVRAIQTRVEEVPLALLRSDVVLAALDSRRARMTVNQAAFRLGVPWIDAGVDADGLLARVQVFVPGDAVPGGPAPGDTAPCLECAWGPRDYELVEQVYACQGAARDAGQSAATASTGAPAALGALAASLQAIECGKLLSGQHEHLLAGRDVMTDARHHRQLVTRFSRHASCRMPDHEPWRIEPYDADPASTTLGDFLAMASTLRGASEGVRVAVAGQVFAAHVTCEACGARTAAGFVQRGLGRAARCGACGGRAVATGFDFEDALPAEAWEGTVRNRSLSELGVLVGDVVTLTTPEVELHLEIGGA